MKPLLVSHLCQKVHAIRFNPNFDITKHLRKTTLAQEVFLEPQHSRFATRLRSFATLSRLKKNLWDQGTKIIMNEKNINYLKCVL